MAPRVLWSVRDLNLTIGKQILFQNAEIAIHADEHVALVGRNGSGKSTLLKIIAGMLPNIQGNYSIATKLRTSFLPQDFEIDRSRTVRENVSDGLRFWENLLREYENKHTGAMRHDEIEHLLTMHDAWHLDSKLDTILSKLELDESRSCEKLSGGETRKVALGRAIIAEPDLLLLDEPTNHLDVEVIGWIENFLASFTGSCLFITHDRYFLDRLADRVVELDNGKFFSNPGSYADFMAAKLERETAEDLLEDKRKKFLRQEIEWVRRSPKARLRRNMGRVRKFDEISSIDAPTRVGDMDLVIPPASRIGNQTVILDNISLAFGDRKIIRDFSYEFAPDGKIGIIGPNGIGKSSLLKIITDTLNADSGNIKRAPALEFNYIDQGKLELDPEKTVAEEIAEGVESVILGTEKISVWGYLKRFLFEDERINTQIKYLSGGEKARLTMAKILKKGGNFLILDEPTNDLDLSSLRLLEEALIQYNGCLLLVSHDRYFLNRVCDTILAFEGDGHIQIQVGDYDYYLEKRKEREDARQLLEKKTAPSPRPVAAVAKAPAKKLSFKEQQELDSMEARIAREEEGISEIEALFSSPDFFNSHRDEAAKLNTRLQAHRDSLEELYVRWDELEKKKEALAKQ